jgi:hypothetical protein
METEPETNGHHTRLGKEGEREGRGRPRVESSHYGKPKDPFPGSSETQQGSQKARKPERSVVLRNWKTETVRFSMKSWVLRATAWT